MSWGHVAIRQIEAKREEILSYSSDLTANLLNEFRIFPSLDIHNERAMLILILSLIPLSIYWCLLCTQCWVYTDDKAHITCPSIDSKFF